MNSLLKFSIVTPFLASLATALNDGNNQQGDVEDLELGNLPGFAENWPSLDANEGEDFGEDETGLVPWPQPIPGDENFEPLDTENIEIVDVTDHDITIICGGDWQIPRQVVIRLGSSGKLVVADVRLLDESVSFGNDSDLEAQLLEFLHEKALQPA